MASALYSIWHPFSSIEAARAALRVWTGKLTLRVRSPYPVAEGSSVQVKFQIGHGPIHEAAGSVEDGGSTPTVRFQGAPAMVVREAIDRPASTRRFVRFPCWLPTAIWTDSSKVVHAYACDISVGGAQVILLSRMLSPGAEVHARFGRHREPVAARVAWTAARAAAGLEFVPNTPAALLVRRLVTDVVLRAEQGRRP